ncbi:MAG: hypothetical protein GYA87_08900 [Christensenellaceae bacterium]|nr:hypothetical protein [Christensenellaceae bacterium]
MNNGQRPQYTSNPTFNQKKKSSFWQKKNNKKSNTPVNQPNQAYTANNTAFSQSNIPVQNNLQNTQYNNAPFAQQPVFNHAMQQTNPAATHVRGPQVYNSNTYLQHSQHAQLPNQNMYNPQTNFNSFQGQGQQGTFLNNNQNVQPFPPQFNPNINQQYSQQFAYNQQYNFNQRYAQNPNDGFANFKKRNAANMQTNQQYFSQPVKQKSSWRFQSFAKTLYEWIKKPTNMSLISLFVLLPILFLLALSIHETVFKFAFIIGAVIALIWLFWKKPYSDGIRLTMTVTYSALMLIIAINLITGIQPGQVNTNKPNTVTTNESPSETIPPEAQPTVAAVAPTEEGEKTASQQRFEMFMEYWKVGKIDEMATLVAPSWASTQGSPTQALFNILSNRRPADYTVENLSGTDADQALTVTLKASINKFTSDELEVMRYQIIMLKENGIWYIDPSSLATRIKEETPDPNATPAPTDQPRTTVTPKPDGNTKLYYNSSGGSYYHVDPECPRVAKKYLPLTSFLYSELGNAPFNKLLPCLECGAPTN